VSGSTVTTDQPSMSVLGIDNSGNIWITDTYSRRVIKVQNLAAPNSINYLEPCGAGSTRS
jgi:hypothetical protein